MKEYKCVMTKGDHKVGDPTEIYTVSNTLEDYEKNGWHLNTYQVAFCPSGGHMVYTSGFYHFLLFEKEKTA